MLETILAHAFTTVKTIFLFSLVIGFVAFIHELGHFLAAKMCNVRVDAFAIGMGRRLFARTFGETEYSLRLLPIGGFVLLAQEDGPQDGAEDAGERAFSAKPLYQRIFILLAGPAMNVLGTMAILTLSLSSFGQPETTLMVTHIVEGSPAVEAGFQPGDRFVALNDQRIERFEQGRMWIAENAGKDLKVTVLRGRSFEMIQPEVLLSELKNLSEPFLLRSGFKGESVKTFRTSTESIRQLLSQDTENLDLELARKLENLDLVVTPSSGGRIGVGIRPFYLSDRMILLPFSEATPEAIRTTLLLTQQLFEQLVSMFSNLISKFAPPAEIGGPIAIANTVAKHSERGLNSMLLLTAQICLCIGIFNLVPIPGLDGGRILVLTIKDGVNTFGRMVLRRKEDTFNDTAEGYVNVLGVLCVFTLMIVVTIKDIGDLWR